MRAQQALLLLYEGQPNLLQLPIWCCSGTCVASAKSCKGERLAFKGLIRAMLGEVDLSDQCANWDPIPLFLAQHISGRSSNLYQLKSWGWSKETYWQSSVL